jgi:hypothetical protein
MTKTVAFRIYFSVATLEGMVAFILLFRDRSMERSAWFLGYSAPRLALGALTLTALIVFIWLTARSFLDVTRIGERIDRQASKKNRLLIISIALLIIALTIIGALIMFSPSLLSQALFYPLLIALERAYPAVIWTVALAIQSLALLIVLHTDTYRQEILRDQRTFVIPVLTAMITLAALLRLFASGNPDLSIATADTPNIIHSSRIPLLSWDFLTSNRTPTIALIYKILEPASGYEVARLSEPAVSGTVELAFNPGLHRVAIAQLVAAMLCWFTLAVVVARHLVNPILKILGALLVLVFAISPQLTDWDRVLMSESISFSLFALILALSLEMSVRIARDGRQLNLRTKILAGIWLVSLLFWVFSRDSNAYLVLVTIGALGAPLLIPRLRRHLATRALLVLIALVGLLFTFHNVTLNQSDRWVNPLLNNLIHNVLPYEHRVAFFERHGMPVSDELLAFQTSRGNERGFLELPDFMQWVYDRGASTYALFLLNDPGWTFTTLLSNVDYLFSVNTQPYFYRPHNAALIRLNSFGDYLHTTTGSTVVLAGLLTLGFLAMAFLRRDRTRLAISYMFVWLLLAEFAMLFVSFHGDTLGVQRHTLVAVMPFRLSLWIRAVFVVDQVVSLAHLRRTSIAA